MYSEDTTSKFLHGTLHQTNNVREYLLYEQ